MLNSIYSIRPNWDVSFYITPFALKKVSRIAVLVLSFGAAYGAYRFISSYLKLTQEVKDLKAQKDQLSQEVKELQESLKKTEEALYKAIYDTRYYKSNRVDALPYGFAKCVVITEFSPILPMETWFNKFDLALAEIGINEEIRSFLKNTSDYPARLWMSPDKRPILMIVQHAYIEALNFEKCETILAIKPFRERVNSILIQNEKCEIFPKGDADNFLKRVSQILEKVIQVHPEANVRISFTANKTVGK